MHDAFYQRDHRHNEVFTAVPHFGARSAEGAEKMQISVSAHFNPAF